MITKGLTFYQAVQAMKEGKKVRRPCFDITKYYELSDGETLIIDNFGNNWSIGVKGIEAMDWEIVEEPKKTLWDKLLSKKEEPIYQIEIDVKEALKELCILLKDRYYPKVSIKNLCFEVSFLVLLSIVFISSKMISS